MKVGRDTRVNYVPIRNVYPFQTGGTLTQIAGSQSDYHANIDATSEGIKMNGNVGSTGEEVKPATNPASKPIFAWVGLLVLLIGLMYGAQKFGTSDQRSDFANIKLSAFNILVIALSAIIGTAFLRLIFSRFYIPGVSEVVVS